VSEEAWIAAGMFTGFCAGFAHGHWVEKVDYKQAGICAIGALPIFALAPEYIGVYAGGLISAVAGHLLGCTMRKNQLDINKERKKLYELAHISLEEHDKYVMGALLDKLKKLEESKIDEWNNVLNTTRYFARVFGSLDEMLANGETVKMKVFLQENEETDGALYIIEQDVVTKDSLEVDRARIIEQDDNPVKRLEMMAKVRRRCEFGLDKHTLADLIHKEKGMAILVSGEGPYPLKHEAGIQAYAQLAGSRLCGLD